MPQAQQYDSSHLDMHASGATAAGTAAAAAAAKRARAAAKQAKADKTSCKTCLQRGHLERDCEVLKLKLASKLPHAVLRGMRHRVLQQYARTHNVPSGGATDVLLARICASQLDPKPPPPPMAAHDDAAAATATSPVTASASAAGAAPQPCRVPHDLTAGGQFDVQVGGEAWTVVVPDGVQGGSVINLIHPGNGTQEINSIRAKNSCCMMRHPRVA